MGVWTLERRRWQSAMMQIWRPWEHSTGPRTPAGKAKTRYNGMKHGGRSQQMREVNKLLAQLRESEREARKRIQ